MYGGWYSFILRNGRTVALVYGPCKTRQEMPVLTAKEANAVFAASPLEYEAREGDVYSVGFFLFDEIVYGVGNNTKWLSYTNEPWSMG